MQVSEILRGKRNRVVSINPDKRVVEAAQLLRQEDIGSVMVRANSGDMLGVVSERDIVHLIAERGAAALEAPVADVMTRSIVTCTPDTDSEVVMENMLSAHVRHLLVVEDGEPVGIVSIRDVVKGVVSGLKRVRQALGIRSAISDDLGVSED